MVGKFPRARVEPPFVELLSLRDLDYGMPFTGPDIPSYVGRTADRDADEGVAASGQNAGGAVRITVFRRCIAISGFTPVQQRATAGRRLLASPGHLPRVID